MRSLLLIRRLPPLLSLEDTFVEDTGNTGTGSGSGTTLPDDGIPRSANAAVLEGSAMSSVMEVRLPGLRRRPRLPFLAATSAVSKLGSMGATMPRSRRAAELEGSPKIWSIELRFLFLLRRRLALSVGRAERVDGAKGRSEDMLRPFLARMFWTFAPLEGKATKIFRVRDVIWGGNLAKRLRFELVFIGNLDSRSIKGSFFAFRIWQIL